MVHTFQWNAKMSRFNQICYEGNRMRGSNLERWKPFTEGKHLTTSLQCTYRKQPDYLESLCQGGSLAGASLKPRMPQKERGSASKGLWPGRRERPQSMLSLEQFLSSPDLFAAISLKCPGLSCSPGD